MAITSDSRMLYARINGAAEEIAHGVARLLSCEASQATGANLRITVGMLQRGEQRILLWHDLRPALPDLASADERGNQDPCNDRLISTAA
ncbi:MAG: hypothetical protein R3D44_07975 [Hyphomicrobiaceae bacterium]